MTQGTYLLLNLTLLRRQNKEIYIQNTFHRKILNTTTDRCARFPKKKEPRDYLKPPGARSLATWSKFYTENITTLRATVKKKKFAIFDWLPVIGGHQQLKFPVLPSTHPPPRVVWPHVATDFHCLDRAAFVNKKLYFILFRSCGKIKKIISHQITTATVDIRLTTFYSK